MLINRELITHPLNWVIVVLMVMIGSLVMSLIITPFKSPATSNT